MSYTHVKSHPFLAFWHTRLLCRCMQEAITFWDKKILQPKVSNNETQLLIMMITLKRTVDFVHHTAKTIYTAIQDTGMEDLSQLVLCNLNGNDSNTNLESMANVINTFPIRCEDRTHHCFSKEEWYQ